MISIHVKDHINKQFNPVAHALVDKKNFVSY